MRGAEVKVSVCLRTRNQIDFVERAVVGTLSQVTDFPYEVIIADDRSTDGTLEVAAEYADRHADVVRLLRHDERVGGRATFIEVQRAARGEYVALLDGDDAWTSTDKLQRQADALDAHENWVMCFHRVDVVDDRGGPSRVFPSDTGPRVRTLDDLLMRNFITSCSVMYRNGRLDADLEWLRTAPRPGDWCVYLLLARDGDIGFIDEVMAEYRVHQGGHWSQRPSEEQAREALAMLRATRPRLGEGHELRARIGELRLWAFGRKTALLGALGWSSRGNGAGPW